MPRPFKGTINLDIRDSTPDWDAFLPEKAPEGAPNVLVVLYDDTGLAAWSPYGGRIEMPTLQRLADNGLTYSQSHTTALCSPTRSVVLTGRNHHQNERVQAEVRVHRRQDRQGGLRRGRRRVRRRRAGAGGRDGARLRRVC